MTLEVCEYCTKPLILYEWGDNGEDIDFQTPSTNPETLEWCSGSCESIMITLLLGKNDLFDAFEGEDQIPASAVVRCFTWLQKEIEGILRP